MQPPAPASLDPSPGDAAEAASSEAAGGAEVEAAGAAEAASSEAAGGAEVERRRRRALVFGDVLPEATSDERGEGWGDGPGAGHGDGDAGDDWLRRQVPPHHG